MTIAFEFAEFARRDGRNGPPGERFFLMNDFVHLLQEPGINVSHLMNLFDGAALIEGEADVIEAVGIGRDEPLIDESRIQLGAGGFTGFETAQTFAQSLFESAADGHGFADRFHLRVENGFGTGEFFELPAWNFDDDVIDSGFETGGRGAGDVVLDFIETVAHGEFGGDFGNGEAGGFGCESGTARDAGIHFNDDHAAILRIDGELHVGAAGIDADFVETAQSGVAHHLIFAIGESLRGSNRDGIAGVDTHGIEVFDGADDDAVACKIAHDFELKLFPTEDAFFDEHFVDGRKIDAAFENLFELFAIVSDAATGAAHGETGAQDDGIADAFGKLQAVFEIVDELRLRHIETDFLHRIFEEETVFGFLDRFDFGADEFDFVFVEHACFGKFDGEVESGLAADSREQGIRALFANDLSGIGDAERFDVGAVGELGVGHDGGRVGVDEDDLVAFLAKGFAGLGAGVIEFAGLADDDGPGADDHDAAKVGAFRHGQTP